MALAFPNTYWVGMSNLGFQTVYRLLNAEDDVVCERFFLPPKQELAEQLAANTPVVTLESQTPVGDFDVIAFSVSFEWDYVNVLTLLRLAGVPRYAAERTSRHPLVVIGGAVTFVNPEPLALFADAIAAGEGEVLVPSLRRAFGAASDRADLLRRLSRERGFYIPSFYEPYYAADGSLAGYHVSSDAPMPVQKAALKTTEMVDPPVTSIFTPDTEFGVAPARRSRPRLREPVPLLLGRLQLPARPPVSRPSGSSNSPKRRGRTQAGSGSCRLRSATIRTSSASSRR